MKRNTPRAAETNQVHDSFECPNCKWHVHPIAKNCFKCGAAFDEPKHTLYIPTTLNRREAIEHMTNDGSIREVVEALINRG